MSNNLKGVLSSVGGLTASLSATRGLTAALSSEIFIRTQAKTVTPTDSIQEVVADDGYAGLSKVTVNAIPSNYGKILWNGATITVI